MRRFWLFLAVFTAACSDERAFPDDFVFGTAVAGFQVDMGCPTIAAGECEDPKSDWYAYVTSTAARDIAATHLAGHPPSMGPGFYETFEQDLDRIEDLGLGGFRFSIEWSRIFPDSTIGVEGHDALKARADSKALDYYKRQLAALKARGIAPLVTLNHYTLPLWIHDGAGCTINFDACSPKGWLEESIVAEMAKYAGFMAKELGGEVDSWATLNEPLAVIIPGYLMPSAARTNPPAQLLKYVEAKAAIGNMIDAHAAMVDAVRANDTIDADGDGDATFIGIVYPVAPILPKTPGNALDERAAENISYIYNDIFLNAVIKGELDEDLDGKAEPRPHLAGRCDYLGLNYYFKIVVEGTEESLLPDFSPLLTFNPLALEQGEKHPSGLRDVLLKIKNNYPELPVMITENGAATEIPGGQELFLREHLQWLLVAMKQDEVDVRGYYWWSLMDNYEWNHGMNMDFGLFAVDPADSAKTRARRPVADLYSRIVLERALPEETGDLPEIR